MQQALAPSSRQAAGAARSRRHAAALRCSASSAPPAAAAEPYEGVFDKPLGLKFARGNDGGAYLISKSPAPEYASFEIGDKILEVRCASSLALLEACGGSRARPVSRRPPLGRAHACPAPCSVRRSGRRRTMDKVRGAKAGCESGRPCAASAGRALRSQGMPPPTSRHTEARCSPSRPRLSYLCHQDAQRGGVSEDGPAGRCGGRRRRSPRAAVAWSSHPPSRRHGAL